MGGGVFTYIVDLANELVNEFDMHIAYTNHRSTQLTNYNTRKTKPHQRRCGRKEECLEMGREDREVEKQRRGKDMADIKVTNTNIDGLFVIEPTIFSDNRGDLFEAYNDDVFSSHGLNLKFVQDNEVSSKKNVLRGMHVNVKHPQGKLVRVLDGKILDVVIDLRKESPTYMSCYSIVLSNDNKKQLYIPEGMGHGYLALQDSRVLFKTTTHYIPGDELGFAWNSKAVTVDWGAKEPIQNDRDKSSKDLSEVWK